MSFSKIKNQSLPDMINIFHQQFQDFISTYENNQRLICQPNIDQILCQKIQIFDYQIKIMESKLNDSPDNEKLQYTHQFQTILSEYFQFKEKNQIYIEKCFNEHDLNTDENQHILFEQSIEDQVAQNLEYIAREAEIITRHMKELNDISDQVFKEINSQNNKIVAIESITDESVKKMENGNKQLEIAEKNQKICNIY